MSSAEEIKDKIKERGYWEIVLKPTQYPEKLFSLNELRNILEECQVRHREWYYPHISNHQEYGDYYNVDNYVESWIRWGEHAEVFRFYQSGQFIHYKGMPEDRRDDHPPLFTKWDPSFEHPPPTQSFLKPFMALYSLTEIFLFASKLAQKEVFGEDIYISIKLHGQLHRILKTVDPMRAGFVHHNECHSKTIDLGPSVVTREQLRLEHDEMAVKNAIRVLELFNYTSEHLKKSFEDDQKEFYDLSF
ncbi:MAG: hypothetical protein IIA83_01030 [Thaumarchaeota archaeon]|nr:hypothetical protein [Nitrososphaerota archaeon]